MIFCKLKKIISGILLGFGMGVLLVLFLPPVAWMCIIGIAMIISGFKILLGK